MIYTRFGSEVEIIKGCIDTGEVDIRFKDGRVMKTFINELKADEGLVEIEKAINDNKIVNFKKGDS